MIIDWFNARDAVELGNSLADRLSSTDRTSPGRNRPARTPAGTAERQIRDLLQWAAQKTRPLPLNVYKRAKLLGTFKWRLLEHGFDSGIVDELTHLLTLQLSGAPPPPPAGPAPKANRPAGAGSTRRIPGLLAEADAQFAAGNVGMAAERLEEALAIDPRHAPAHASLGAVLYRLARYAEAEQEFRRAVELRPKFGEAHLNLGTLLRERGQFAASETALRRAVKCSPDNPVALASLGLTLGMRAQLSEARACFEAALRLKPGNAAALCSMGWLAAIEGRFEEAEGLCREALASDPGLPGAWAQWVELRRMSTRDTDWLEAVQGILAGRVPPLEEAKLRFALGKYFDDLDQPARAFEQFKRANELRKPIATAYDRAARTALVDERIRVYTRERLGEAIDGASDSAKPVLVTGMPRSGTSLVEQIIASHPGAAGAGELDFWSAAALRHEAALRRAPPEGSLTERLATSYLATLAAHSAQALRVIDKSTLNADHLGLFSRTFPKARIICLRRDPIDTCLSCYFHDFANTAAFAMDLTDLAHYYREHHRLMAHWRTVLPAGTLLEVPYAGLVADQEGWSRRIIEFIGLEWDPRCLEFHRTRRAVVTASQWQVRQPIYSRSVGRWREYSKFIGPLLELRSLAGCIAAGLVASCALSLAVPGRGNPLPARRRPEAAVAAYSIPSFLMR